MAEQRHPWLWLMERAPWFIAGCALWRFGWRIGVLMSVCYVGGAASFAAHLERHDALGEV